MKYSVKMYSSKIETYTIEADDSESAMELIELGKVQPESTRTLDYHAQSIETIKE